MKNTSSKLFLSFMALMIYSSMFAQDSAPKKLHKENSAGEKIEAKKIKQKQLYGSPVVISQPDSSSKKKTPVLKKKKKSNSC